MNAHTFRPAPGIPYFDPARLLPRDMDDLFLRRRQAWAAYDRAIDSDRVSLAAPQAAFANRIDRLIRRRLQ